VLIGVITLTWICWGADAYWVGHFQRLTQDIGQVSGVVSKGTVGRIGEGASSRRLVLATRVGLSLAAWAAAGAWLLWAVRRGRNHLFTIGVLAAVPIGAVALQSYGGELGLRIFLFSLPFASLLLADGVDAALSRTWKRPPMALAAALGIAIVVTAGFAVARYGNEQFEQTYREDVAVTRAFQRTAPLGAYVYGSNTSNPFRMLPYHDYRPRKDADLALTDQLSTEKVLQATGVSRGYVVVYESSIKESHIRAGAPADWNVSLDRQLRALGAKVLFRDGRAALYRYHVRDVGPIPTYPTVREPYVSPSTKALLARPALAGALLVILLLLLACVLHVTGRRWRSGWLETVALLTSIAVIVVVFARFEILT
jgi:hypothetical protein